MKASGGRKNGETKQRQNRTSRRLERPRLIHDQARRDENDRAAHERPGGRAASGRSHRNCGRRWRRPRRRSWRPRSPVRPSGVHGSPRERSTPTMRQMPTMPETMPKSLRPVAACRPMRHQVRMNVKIGEVEFRIVARPASTVCSAQAISVNGKHAVEARLEQEAAPEREVLRQRHAAHSANGQQHQRRDGRASGDQGDRRQGLHPHLDERERRAPQRGEHQRSASSSSRFEPHERARSLRAAGSSRRAAAARGMIRPQLAAYSAKASRWKGSIWYRMKLVMAMCRSGRSDE